jgi:putative restriction endonuclease
MALVVDRMASRPSEPVVLRPEKAPASSSMRMPVTAEAGAAATAAAPNATAAAGLSIDAHDVVLVVEIASPSTRVTDRKMKPALYATAGIPRYWRLELEPAPRLYCGIRHGSSGYTDLTLTAGRAVDIAEPFPVTIDPAQLLT